MRIPRPRGGASGCQDGHCPPKILPGPSSGPPKFFRSHSESPTQTIDSSPCCKTGPSSGPPKKNVWLRPCLGQSLPCLKQNAVLKFVSLSTARKKAISLRSFRLLLGNIAQIADTFFIFCIPKAVEVVCNTVHLNISY